MMKSTRTLKVVFGSMLLAGLMFLPGAVFATVVAGNSSSVTIYNPPSGVTSIKIATPGGAIVSAEGLTITTETHFIDGDYQYELIGSLGAVSPQSTQSTDPANGRGEIVLQAPVGVIESGDFRIVNGQVIDTRTLTEN